MMAKATGPRRPRRPRRPRPMHRWAAWPPLADWHWAEACSSRRPERYKWLVLFDPAALACIQEYVHIHIWYDHTCGCLCNYVSISVCLFCKVSILLSPCQRYMFRIIRKKLPVNITTLSAYVSLCLLRCFVLVSLMSKASELFRGIRLTNGALWLNFRQSAPGTRFTAEPMKRMRGHKL